MKNLVFLVIIICINSCSSDQPQTDASTSKTKPTGTTTNTTTIPQPPSTPVVIPTVVKEFPHDPYAFTQGLTIAKGVMYESTGQYGVSELRQVDQKSGRVLKSVRLGGQYFGEGSTIINGQAYVLTWLNQEAFVFDAVTFKKKPGFTYGGEGWGLTTDGAELYMSNGTDIIAVRNPVDMSITRTITVQLDGKPCRYLNELEWIEGEIWANVWQSDMILRIDPTTGKVRSVLNLSALYPVAKRVPPADVLNGIAYDAATKAIYVTGKNWPTLYQISVP